MANPVKELDPSMLPETKPSELAALKVEGHERRQFSRAEVQDRKIEVQFSSGSQFAKQYIDNISIGGLYIKTSEKASMGDLIKLEFSVPPSEGKAEFRITLQARVTRVDNSGIGMEFINVSKEIRNELEEFVKNALVHGNLSASHKPKVATVEKLEERRQKKRVQDELRRSRAFRFGLLLTLCLGNIWMYQRNRELSIDEQAKLNSDYRIQIGDNSFSLQSIRSLRKLSDQKWAVSLVDGSEVTLNQDDLQKKFPFYLQQSSESLMLIQKPAPVRRSKTNPKLVQLR